MGEVSDCADGFPTLFHIDRLAGNIGNLDTNDNDRRQVVIPDINFGYNGAITRWIVGAQWEGRTIIIWPSTLSYRYGGRLIQTST